MDDIISENWRTPGLPIGNYYASLGNKYAYFYAAHCVNENPGRVYAWDFPIKYIHSPEQKNQCIAMKRVTFVWQNPEWCFPEKYSQVKQTVRYLHILIWRNILIIL